MDIIIVYLCDVVVGVDSVAINHQFSLLRYLYILVSLLIIMSLLLLSGDIHLNPGPLIDNCISLWHGNVRGLNCPFKLRSLFNIVNNYDIIALTENCPC